MTMPFHLGGNIKDSSFFWLYPCDIIVPFIICRHHFPHFFPFCFLMAYHYLSPFVCWLFSLNIERIENKKNIKRGRMQKKKRKEKKTQPFVLVLVFKISKESYKEQNKKELPVQHCTHVLLSSWKYRKTLLYSAYSLLKHFLRRFALSITEISIPTKW
jgi:hypothetical protein